MELLKQTSVQDAGLCTWLLHFSAWDTILRVLVCPDFIENIIPELNPVMSKIEQIN